MTSLHGPAGLSPEEYRDHRATVRTHEVLWENNGWSLRGTAGARDFLLWTSPYLLHGSPNGAFRLEEASAQQTLLFFAEDLERPLTEPNDFIAVGWEPDQLGPWAAWDVAQQGDQVGWSSEGREFVTASDHWRIRGEHASVGLDIRLDPVTDALWLSPPAQPLGDREDRWFIANAEVDGSMTIDGEPLPLAAHALHERHVHKGTTYNPVTLLRGEGVTWHSGRLGEVGYSVLARPELGLTWTLVTVGDRTWRVADAKHTSVRATDHWVDPETWLHVPRAWELSVQTDDLSLELTTTAHARAYYLWNFLRDGVTVLYWWLCTSEGRLQTEGGTRELARVKSEVHLNKTIYEARHRR